MAILVLKRGCTFALIVPNSTSPILAVPATVRKPSGAKNIKSPANSCIVCPLTHPIFLVTGATEKLEELVKSYYDYTTNKFPKGETAVITACEKEFGDKAIPVAQKMIDRLQGGKDREMERIKQLAGV